MTATCHNKIVAEFYNRLPGKGKIKKVALIAAMRKLLVIAVGVLNNQVPFDPSWEQNRKKELDF
ncbi:MAG: hypothetical protein IEMM0008_1896 [bacterium]|nr:MAG: hypothetical protein IEMM0008_1896 [bacterium]